MNRYRQLSADERVQIATLRYQNFSLPYIARILGRHRRTVWREVQRHRAPTSGRWPGANALGAINSLAARRWPASRRC